MADIDPAVVLGPLPERLSTGQKGAPGVMSEVCLPSEINHLLSKKVVPEKGVEPLT